MEVRFAVVPAETPALLSSTFCLKLAISTLSPRFWLNQVSIKPLKESFFLFFMSLFIWSVTRRSLG